jgi:hypothetical protein
VTLCAVCIVHEETRSAGLLIKHQNQGRRFVSNLVSKPLGWFVNGLTSKPVVTVSSGLASKPVARVSQFGHQNRQLRFVDLCLKITVTFSRFGHQNQTCFSLSVASQNRRRKDGVRHASRCGDLLRLKVSRDRVSQSGLNIGGGTTTSGGACDIITKVVSSES